jgi:hypothetical protein|tara:strand:+ start:9636 stop:10220 length:585 start_codon:yes stop_codon:yes gene_type:complete
MKNSNVDTLMRSWYIDTKICDQILLWADNNDHLYHDVKLERPNKKIEYDKREINISSNDFSKPWYFYRKALNSCAAEYIKQLPHVNFVFHTDIVEPYNLQHYKPGQGFYNWHCENNGTPNHLRKRNLVFMTYLNDVEKGGTEFYHQNLTVPAKKGLTLIWPAYWTHTHRGQITKIDHKYIVTGWYSFLDKEPSL